jgi:hypothetical protein
VSNNVTAWFRARLDACRRVRGGPAALIGANVVTRRSIIRAGALTPLAVSGLAGVSNAAMSSSSSDPSPARPAAAGVNLVGYSPGKRGIAAYDEITGRVAKVVRAYHRVGAPVPASLAQAKLLGYLRDENRHVVYSLKVPDSSPATVTACGALAADIATQGFTDKVWLILWHEPFPDLTAADFIARYRAIAPAIRDHGVRCGVCFHTYPIWHRQLDYTTYWPGDEVTDFLAIDTYPPDAPDDPDDPSGLGANPLATIAPLTSFAKAHGKPFGVAEFGIRDTTASREPDKARAWLGRFERLGASCRFVTYFNGGNAGLDKNTLLVPAYQHLYDHFS